MVLHLIASATADEPGTGTGETTLSFLNGIDGVVLDNTFNEYQFYFVNMHPENDEDAFGFQVNAAGGSGFNERITSTLFASYHRSNDSGTPNVSYEAGSDQAEGVLYQPLADYVMDDADNGASGVLTLYDPSSPTYITHFVGRSQAIAPSGVIRTSVEQYAAGYINTASAIDEISFAMDTGNIDAGTIYMYGVG